MATTPEQRGTTVDKGIAEVLDRYEAESVIGRFMTRAGS